MLALVLIETVLVQALGTMSVLLISALSPAVAATLAVPTSYVGYQITIVYLSAMGGSLVAGRLVLRHGGCRTGQIAMLLNAMGCTLASYPGILAIATGSVIIGAAYGLINPASSALLLKHADPRRRSLIFSIKQAGVPLGGVAAGVGAPWIALQSGWRVSLIAGAGACLAMLVVAEFGRARLDAEKSSVTSAPSFFAALGVVWTRPSLKWLAISSFFFSATQLSIVAFLVALLVEEKQLGLAAAGAVLAAVQMSGALGRVLWGAVADWIGKGTSVLTALALISAGASLAIGIVPDIPIELLLATLLVLGLTANGWNGVFLADIARLSPAHSIGAATGASLFFTFAGVVVGPSAYSVGHRFIGSYQAAYLLIAALCSGALFCVLQAMRTGSK